MDNQINTTNINLEISIKASINKVWECLLNETNEWWRKDFYTSTKTQKFILEPFVGGKMYEDYGNGEGLIWANVIGLNSPNSIELIAHLSPQFGGPALSFLRITLSENSNITTLKFSDHSFGNVTDATKNQIEEGWKMIYEEAFKNYVEKK